MDAISRLRVKETIENGINLTTSVSPGYWESFNESTPKPVTYVTSMKVKVDSFDQMNEMLAYLAALFTDKK